MTITMRTIVLFLAAFLALSLLSMILAGKAGGSDVSEGVVLLNADTLHTMGVLGSGVTVGVISDGADSLASAVATLDLPPGVAVFGTCTVSARSCDEGTAMLEIVHDMAPAADLAFCSGLGSPSEFNQCLTYLVNHGVDVIVDDVLFYEEPYFSDGQVAQNVHALLGSIVYVTSAGNDALNHYEALKAGGGFEHDFGEAAGGAVDPFMDIRVGTGENNVLTIYLQWNDPWGAAVANFNMRLWDNNLSAEIATALGDQTGSDPIETLSWTNTSGQEVTVKLLVEGLGGETSTFEMFLKGNGFKEAEYVDGAGGIIGHGAVPGVITVGAVDSSAPDVIEPYSSGGPSVIGTATSVSRPKPDLVAVANVLVSGAGGFGSPFSGTSAAAPHVAGIAALLMGEVPTATVSEIRSALRSSALDLGASGRDDTYGHGRVDALEAYNALTSVSDGGGGGGGCFVATALYGSREDSRVLLLRRFRDEVLSRTAPGRAFIEAYYRNSPPIAHWLDDKGWARVAGRVLLWPIVFFAWLILKSSMVAVLVILAAGTVMVQHRS